MALDDSTLSEATEARQDVATVVPMRKVPLPKASQPPKVQTAGSNTVAAQRPDRNTGDAERIAERRVKSFNLRKAGASYRQIASQLSIDVSTAWADVNAELYDLRQQTRENVEEVRQMELQRLDAMTLALEPKIRQAEEAAINASLRVMERRAKLLGLDEASEMGVPVDQVYAFMHRVVGLVTHTFSDKQEIARFLDGLRQLVGRAKPIDAIATSAE